MVFDSDGNFDVLQDGTDAVALEYSTSPLLPADDPSAWPLLWGREATSPEQEALYNKLTALKRAAELFKHTLSGTKDEDLDLVVASEDDPLSFTKLLLPAALPEQLELALTRAGQLLHGGEHSAAVAHLRYAEVLLRLANGWGHAEVQAQVDGFMGLTKGQRAGALILTTNVTRSQTYGDVAERSVTLVGE